MKPAREEGFTLLEVLVSGAISSVVIAGIAVFVLTGYRTFDSISTVLAENEELSLARMLLTEDIRSAYPPDTTTVAAGAGTVIGSLTNTTMNVVSAAGFPGSGNYFVQVRTEVLTVSAGQGTTTWTVTRGSNGSSAISTIAAADTVTPTCASPDATLTCRSSDGRKLRLGVYAPGRTAGDPAQATGFRVIEYEYLPATGELTRRVIPYSGLATPGAVASPSAQTIARKLALNHAPAVFSVNITPRTASADIPLPGRTATEPARVFQVSAAMRPQLP